MNEHCVRNCTQEELKHKQHIPGKCFQNVTFHHLSNHNIVVSNLQSTDNDDSNEKLIREIYSSLEPAINKLLPVNCTSHPHIIYIPVQMINKTKKINANLIEGHVHTNSEVSKDRTAHANLVPTGKLITNDTSDNDTCCLKKFTVTTVPTNLGKNKNYKIFISWFPALCFALIPLILIATFNCFLVHAVYKSQSRRRKMTNSQVRAKECSLLIIVKRSR